MIRIQTAIFGNYDTPKPLILEDVCYSANLFSDGSFKNHEIGNLGWNFWPSPYFLGDNTTSMLRAKYFKTRQPAASLRDDDVFIWLDGSMRITEPKLVEKCLQALGDDDACFMKHPDRHCVYQEAEFSLRFPRYQNVGIERQLQEYSRLGMPEKWGLIATGFFVMRIIDWTRQLLADWWEECQHGSHQDQISLPFLLWRSKQTKWNTNIRYGEWFKREEHLV